VATTVGPNVTAKGRRECQFNIYIQGSDQAVGFGLSIGVVVRFDFSFSASAS
jgi:hypothetical protein